MKHVFKKLFLLFTLTPIVELYLLFQLAHYTSPLTAIGVVLLTGALGAYLAKGEGMAVTRRIRAEMAAGQVPGDALLNGLCVLIGGLLLLTPGLITDALGFSLLYPGTRAWYVQTMKTLAKDRIELHIDGGV